MKLPELKIGNLVARVPIIQGGMAIRISTAKLAAAVGEEGGIGLIAASGMSFDELRSEIRLARSLTKGIIGINIMVAAREFSGIVKTAIEEGIAIAVAGARFPRQRYHTTQGVIRQGLRVVRHNPPDNPRRTSGHQRAFQQRVFRLQTELSCFSLTGKGAVRRDHIFKPGSRAPEDQ